jgi:hypothetical protein
MGVHASARVLQNISGVRFIFGGAQPGMNAMCPPWERSNLWWLAIYGSRPLACILYARRGIKSISGEMQPWVISVRAHHAPPGSL